MNENPTLADFLATVPDLGAREVGSPVFDRWHQIFIEHLVNRHRAVTDDLHPKAISEYGSRLRKHLAGTAMTGLQAEAVHQLTQALVAGDEPWRRTVLDHLGLDLSPKTGITPLHRSVLVHVFRRHSAPYKETWFKAQPEALSELLRDGYIDDSAPMMKLTEEGLAAAGVLWPRVRYNYADGHFTTGPEAHGVLIGPVRDGQQAVVKLLAVAGDWAPQVELFPHT